MRKSLNEKIKLLVIFTAIFAVSLFSLSIFRSCFNVSASVGPLKILISKIEFGTVFPEESLEKEFTVNLDPSWQGGEVQYKISQRIKPVEEGEETEEDPDNPGYYRNLCGYLTELKGDEGENDTISKAWIGPDDISDVWHFTLNVPCIKGSEGQDWEGRPAVEKGVYGCDLVIETEEESGSGPSGPIPVTNGGGGGYIPPTYRAAINYNYPKEKTVGTEVQERIVISNTGSAVLTNGTLKIIFPSDYLIINGDTDGIINLDAPGISVGADWQVDLDVLPIKNGKDILTEVEFKADGDVDISAKGTEIIGIVSGEEYVPKEGIVAGAEKVAKKIKAKVGPDFWISLVIAGILTGLFWNRSLFRRRFRLKH